RGAALANAVPARGEHTRIGPVVRPELAGDVLAPALALADFRSVDADTAGFPLLEDGIEGEVHTIGLDLLVGHWADVLGNEPATFEHMSGFRGVTKGPSEPTFFIVGCAHSLRSFAHRSLKNLD